MSENFRGGDFFDSHCRSEMLMLMLISYVSLCQALKLLYSFSVMEAGSLCSVVHFGGKITVVVKPVVIMNSASR